MYDCKVTKTTQNITISPHDTVASCGSFGKNDKSLKLFKILFNHFLKGQKSKSFSFALI